MSMRQRRRAHFKRVHRRLSWWWAFYRDLDQWEPDLDYDDDYDYDERLSCTRCGGEGYCQVDDPLWDECDEFGEGPCNACGGTGDRADQTVF